MVATITNKAGESVPGVCTGNHVRLSQEWFNDKNFSNKRKSMVIMHEILHAGTMYAVNTYLQIRKGDKTVSMPKDICDSCARILRVFESIKNNPDFEGQYGKAKMTEMIAELSNPTFVSLLKMSYPSLWHKLIDAICEMLGINRRFNNYTTLKKAVEEILSHPDYRLAGEYYEKARLNSTNFYLDESQYYDANEQYQQRTNTQTDREVLSMGAERLDTDNLNKF